MGNVSISGFNSPFNTDKVVNQLIQVEKKPIQRLESRVELSQSKQDLFKKVNNKFSSLKSSFDSLLDPSTFKQNKTSSSNEDVLTSSISDSDSVSTGTNDVFVEQLAQEASLKSGQFINDQKLFGTNQNTGDEATSISDFEVAEGSDTLNPGSDDLSDLSKNVTTTGSGMDGSGDGQAEFTIREPGGGGPIQELDVDLDNFNNFQEVQNFVNSNFNGVKMKFDSENDKFQFIPTEQDGNGGRTFELEDQNGTNFLSGIGIATNDNGDVHRFDTQQSDASTPENLLSIDADSTFNSGGNLFTSNLDTSGKVKVNNTDIEFDSQDSTDPVSTVNEFVDRVNSKVDGVSANFNEATDRVQLSTEDTGTGNIDVQDVSGNLANVLNIEADGNTSDDGNEDAQGQANAIENLGQDSKIQFNGDIVTNSDNSITVDGLNLDLNQLHKETNNSGNPIEVSVEEDQESIASEVENFVNQFNNVTEFINKNSQERAPDSPDAEGSPAESGPLLGDGTVRRVKNKISNIASSAFEEATSSGSDIRTLGDIGIEQTDPISASETQLGTLEFDKSEFKDALQDNPEQVKELFTAKKNDASRGGNQDGLAVQMNNFLGDVSKDNGGILTSRIDGFDDKVQRLNERIDRQQERVEGVRERLERQFRQMEQMLGSLQQQKSFLSGRL